MGAYSISFADIAGDEPPACLYLDHLDPFDWDRFAAQVADHAGPGAWTTGFTSILCLVITLAALRTGEKNIVRSDWIMFLAGLAAIPLWAVTSNPFWSICLVTAIDCSAFYPTFRKSWIKPYEENTFMYGFNIPRHLLTLFAIMNFSIATALYPAALLLMNVIMYVMLKSRRHMHAKDTV